MAENGWYAAIIIATLAAMTDMPRQSTGSKLRRNFGRIGIYVIVFILGAIGEPLVQRAYAALTSAVGDGPLVVVSQKWPDFSCSPASFGVLPGGPDPMSTTYASGAKAVRTVGVPFRAGQLDLRLSAKDPKPLYIYKIEIATFAQKPDVSPAWVGLLEAGGCGDAQHREFTADLDKPASITDDGIVGDGDPDPDAPQAKLGADFTIKDDDPAHIFVNIKACTGYFEFGLKIHYNYLGGDFETTIGSAAKPFTMVGSAVSVPSYGYQDEKSAPHPSDAIGGCASPGAATSSAGPTSVTPASQDNGLFPAEFAGNWSGTLFQSNGKSWSLTVRIDARTSVAYVQYPAPLNCTANWYVVTAASALLSAREKVLSGTCSATGVVYMAITPLRQLLLTYAPDDGKYTATATLTRS